MYTTSEEISSMLNVFWPEYWQKWCLCPWQCRVHCWTEGTSWQRKCNQSRISNEKENESCSKCKQSQHNPQKIDTSQFTILKNSQWMIVELTSNISMLQKILQCQRILQEGGSVALKWCIAIPLSSHPTTVMTKAALQISEGGTKQSKLLLQHCLGWGKGCQRITMQ